MKKRHECKGGATVHVFCSRRSENGICTPIRALEVQKEKEKRQKRRSSRLSHIWWFEISSKRPELKAPLGGVFLHTARAHFHIIQKEIGF